jgi:hypothetical protein
MPIGYEEEALIAVLEFKPVLQHPMVMPQMQAPGRPHAGEHAPVRSLIAAHEEYPV